MPNVLIISTLVIANSSKIVFVLSTVLHLLSATAIFLGINLLPWKYSLRTGLLFARIVSTCVSAVVQSLPGQFYWWPLSEEYQTAVKWVRIFEYFTETEVAMFLPEDNLYYSYIVCRIGNCDAMYQYCFVFSLNNWKLLLLIPGE